jgi:uncharacterized membrane protein
VDNTGALVKLATTRYGRGLLGILTLVRKKSEIEMVGPKYQLRSRAMGRRSIHARLTAMLREAHAASGESAATGIPIDEVTDIRAERSPFMALKIQHEKFPLRLLVLITIGFLVLFFSALARHILFQSSLYDLGIFSQAAFLISRGETPLITTLGFHILSDHASIILYPLAILYWLWPGPEILLALQSLSFALGSIFIYNLAKQKDLSEHWALVGVACYLLSPVLSNVNMFDFHPEVLAVPALLWAVQAGLNRRPWQLACAVLVILSCKEILSLTVIALGVWLFWVVGQRLYGVFVITVGAGWFLFAIYYLIPHFTPGQLPSGFGRYSYLGASLSEIFWHALNNPGLVVQRFFTGQALSYYVLLLAPVIIGLSWRQAAILLPALPTFLLNVLSSDSGQRTLAYQYQSTIFPFLILWLLYSIAAFQKEQRHLWLTPRWMIAWSTLAFLKYTGYTYFLFSAPIFSNFAAMQEAVHLVEGPGGVLAPDKITAHLSARQTAEMIKSSVVWDRVSLQPYQYVLLDLRHPGYLNDDASNRRLLDTLHRLQNFRETYSRDDVLLFSATAGKALKGELERSILSVEPRLY